MREALCQSGLSKVQYVRCGGSSPQSILCIFLTATWRRKIVRAA